MSPSPVPVSRLSPADVAPPLDLEMLYREHASRMLQAAYRVTGSASDAEDALQTVFVRLAQRREVDGRHPDLAPSPGSYLHRAAVNAALDVMRQRVAARHVDAEPADLPLAHPSGENPEHSLRGAELKAWLRRALTRLSPMAAEVMALHTIEGLANHEIAVALGASKNTVGVLLHRARKELREALAGHFDLRSLDAPSTGDAS